MISEISGNQNPKYKLAKSLLQKKNRVKNKLYTVEGIKSVRDAIAADAEIEMIFVSDNFSGDLTQLENYDCRRVPEYMFAALCDTETPQGVLAVIKMGGKKKLCDDKDKLYIYCDRVSDPGNLGTIIRTADAAGFGGVLLSDGCADLYSPKTVRSSMGSFFNIPIYENISAEDIERLKSGGFRFLCGALSENTIEYTEADFTVPCVIAVGNEANGIRKEILEMADECIKIPIFGAAESLNAGVAAAVLMYEARRQRKKADRNIFS